MARKKKVENAGTNAAARRGYRSMAGQTLQKFQGSSKTLQKFQGSSKTSVPDDWNSSGNQAMWNNKPTPGPGFGPERGNPGAVTSGSGTPGPAGVLTTGHYSSSGQRMYGGYGPTGRGRPRGLDTPDAQANRRARKRLPGAR